MFSCHATSTPKGDASEAECISKINSKALITATKGNVGHMVAGAALTESAFAIKSMQTGQITAIRNLVEPCDNLNFVRENMDKKVDTIVKNSLCFGGVNMSAVFKRYQQNAKL